MPRAGEHIELHIKDLLRKAFRGCLCHITFPSSPDRNSVSDNHAEAITRPPDGVAQRLPIAVLAQHHKLADYTYQQKIRKQEYIAAQCTDDAKHGTPYHQNPVFVQSVSNNKIKGCTEKFLNTGRAVKVQERKRKRQSANRSIYRKCQDHHSRNYHHVPRGKSFLFSYSIHVENSFQNMFGGYKRRKLEYAN